MARNFYFCAGNVTHISQNRYFFHWDLTEQDHPTNTANANLQYITLIARYFKLVLNSGINFSFHWYAYHQCYWFSVIRSNSARKCFMLPANALLKGRWFCSEFIQAYTRNRLPNQNSKLFEDGFLEATSKPQVNLMGRLHDTGTIHTGTNSSRFTLVDFYSFTWYRFKISFR